MVYPRAVSEVRKKRRMAGSSSTIRMRGAVSVISSFDRQIYKDPRTAASTVFGVNPTPMGFNNPFTYGKSQTCTADISGTLDAVEFIEYTLQILRRNASAAVGN